MNRKDDELDWFNFILSIIRLLVYLIMGLMALNEFVLNPANNFSLYAKYGETYEAAGIVCEKEGARVYDFKFEPSNTENETTMIFWLRGHEDNLQRKTVNAKNELTLPGCSDDEANTALVWNISSDQVHLRVHRGFKIDQPEKK